MTERLHAPAHMGSGWRHMGKIWPMEYRSISCMWPSDWPKNLLKNYLLLFIFHIFVVVTRRKDLRSLSDCIAQSFPQSLLSIMNSHMSEKYTYCAMFLRYGIWDCFPAFSNLILYCSTPISNIYIYIWFCS